MGTGSFPGVKCGRGVLLTTHPLLVLRSWKSTAIPLPTLWATPGLQRDHFTFFTLFLFISSNQKFKALSIFIKNLSRTIKVTFAVCGAEEKLARIFYLFFITSRMEDSFLPYNLAISACDFFLNFNHIQNFHFLTN